VFLGLVALEASYGLAGERHGWIRW